MRLTSMNLEVFRLQLVTQVPNQCTQQRSVSPPNPTNQRVDHSRESYFFSLFSAPFRIRGKKQKKKRQFQIYLLQSLAPHPLHAKGNSTPLNFSVLDQFKTAKLTSYSSEQAKQPKRSKSPSKASPTHHFFTKIRITSIAAPRNLRTTGATINKDTI